MMKRIGVVAAVIMAVGIAATAAYAGDQVNLTGQKKAVATTKVEVTSLQSVTKKLQSAQGELSQAMLVIDENAHGQQIGSLKTLQYQVEGIRTVVQMLNDPTMAENAQRFIDYSEQWLKNEPSAANLPKYYAAEINPVLFGFIKKSPAPVKPTVLQKKLLDAGKAGGFDAMANVVAGLIASDISSTQQKISAIQQKLGIDGQQIVRVSKQR